MRDPTSGGPGNDGIQIATGPNGVEDGVFHHLVAVRDVKAKRLLMYLDGRAVVSDILADGVAGPLAPSDDGDVDVLSFGAVADAEAATFSGFFTGAIDEVGFYGVALSADQVRGLFEAQDLGKCP